MHVYVYRGSAAERVVHELRHGWELCGCVAEGRCTRGVRVDRPPWRPSGARLVVPLTPPSPALTPLLLPSPPPSSSSRCA